MSTAGLDLCTIPAGTSPDGVYNFVDPPSQGPAVIAVGVTLCAISTAAISVRLYVNRNSLRSADYFTLVACVINIAFTGIICAQHKFYRHQWDVPVCWYDGSVFKLTFAQTVIWSPAFFFPKAAILLLYQQLFAIQRTIRIAIYVGMVITFLVYLSNIPLAAVYLAPRVGQSWESLILTLETNKTPMTLGGVVQSTIATLIDFYIFILPLPIIARLQMPPAKRFGLIAVFSTALLGVGASIVSLVFKVQLLKSTDVGWLTAITSMASLIETNIAIIVGCMPSLPQFATHTIGGSSFFKSLRSRLLGSTGQPSKGKSDEDMSGPGGPMPTFGAIDQTPRRKDYYELTDSTLLKTQGDTTLDRTEVD
ncbi:hypothetical protein E8E14_000146 [Neopestalotiopsis sp. 37M]|nr:hypothetical protein E8E14_000146 [Neopestalotiopsis sp. 37M]